MMFAAHSGLRMECGATASGSGRPTIAEWSGSFTRPSSRTLRPHRTPTCARHIASASGGRTEVHRSVDPGSPPPLPVEQRRLAPLPFIAGVVVGVALILWKDRTRKARQASCREARFGGFRARPPQTKVSEDPNFTQALAAAKQSKCVTKAVAYRQGGDCARAMIELRRALHENTICRSSLDCTSLSKREIEELYRLHLTHSQEADNFATLLQLRQMLLLSETDAARVERDVHEHVASYSI